MKESNQKDSNGLSNKKALLFSATTDIFKLIHYNIMLKKIYKGHNITWCCYWHNGHFALNIKYSVKLNESANSFICYKNNKHRFKKKCKTGLASKKIMVSELYKLNCHLSLTCICLWLSLVKRTLIYDKK